MANRGANRDHPASFVIACVLNRPGPCLLPLLLAGGTTIALIPPVRADLPPPQGVAASLALPGCRSALGLPATAPPAELLPCAACRAGKPAAEYSKTQLRAAAARRCRVCVEAAQ